MDNLKLYDVFCKYKKYEKKKQNSSFRNTIIISVGELYILIIVKFYKRKVVLIMIKRYNYGRRRFIKESTSIGDRLSEQEPDVIEIFRGAGLTELGTLSNLPQLDGDYYVGYFDDTFVVVDIANGVYVDVFYNVTNDEEIIGILNAMSDSWTPTSGTKPVIIELSDNSQKIMKHKSANYDTIGSVIDVVLDIY